MRGFSLVEMAVVVLLITLLLGSILVPLGTQVDQKRITDTQRQLEEIKEALTGFALSNGYLPCPARSATDGTEDRAGTACNGGKRVGFLPWVTLGLSPGDSWDNLYRYSVTPAFSTSDPINLFTLNDIGDITVKSRDPAGTLVNLTNSPSIPAVVMSFGKNGYGAIGQDGTARFTPVGWAGDEQANATATTTFISRVRTDNTAAAGGQFDDLVVWITPSILFSKMVAAGKLP